LLLDQNLSRILVGQLRERPVGDGSFGAANPVSQAMTGVVEVLDQHQLPSVARGGLYRRSVFFQTET